MAENMFLQKLQAGLFGQPNNYGGMLSEDDLKAARHQAMLAMGAQLMAAGGPSSQPTSLGQALGQGIMAGQQVQQGANESTLQSLLLKSQIEKAQQKEKGRLVPVLDPATGKPTFKYEGDAEGMQPYERALQSNTPAGIQEYEYFQTLTPEQQKQFLSLQRSPVVPQLAVVNGVPTLVDKLNASTTPLSSIESETSAASEQARAKARGQATGEAEGALSKKGVAALNVLETLDLAEPLIDVATGSKTGAATDAVASFFGKSLEGDQAIAQLKIIQAQLMTNMPRMEGPQSDRDVQLYREAAGELGDPNVPRARKRAALNMIRALQERYANGVSVSPQQGGGDINALLDKYAPK